MAEDYNEVLTEITKRLYSSRLSEKLLDAATKDLHWSSLTPNNLKSVLLERLAAQGWDREVKNAVHSELTKMAVSRYATSQSKGHQMNPSDQCYLAKAQETWEKRMLKSVNTMCTEQSLPLARKRPEKDANDIREKWSELSTINKDVSAIRPVYAPKDFLDVLINVRNPNCKLGSTGESNNFFNSWGALQVPFRVKDLHELRLQFRDLAIGQQQSGVDDVDMPTEFFEQEREKFAKKVIQDANSAACQEFCKRGCPLSYRNRMWTSIFSIKSDDQDRIYYNQLKQSVFDHDLLVDTLTFKDVKLTSTNDDMYFVFEDYLYQVLLCFSRDTRVLEHFKHSTAKPPRTFIRGKVNLEEYAVVYPPSGIIPFHGFSMFVAPLCYLMDDPVTLYLTFRELYTKYFYKLHTISPDPQGILGLSVLFENLLQASEPELFYHLKSVGVQPIRLAFKWLMKAFSGYLAPNQVLLLWDRVIAYESLEILPVLAVAIFGFRKSNLAQVRSTNAAEAVLADLTTLQVVPLLQLTLFAV